MPGAIKISKEYAHIESLRLAHVLGHLFPPTIWHHFAQRGGHMLELSREALSGTRSLHPALAGKD